MKLVTGLLGAVGVSALAWSGAWVYGKGAIRDRVDEQIALLSEQGIEASYSDIQIGGFPFGYEGRVIEPRYAMSVPSELGDATYRWEAPWVGIDASARDLSGLSFYVPETQMLLVEPPLGEQPIRVIIDSEGFHGRVSHEKDRARLEGQAESVSIAVFPAGDLAEGGLGADRGDATAHASLLRFAFSASGPQTLDGIAVNGDFDLQGNAAQARIDGAFSGLSPMLAEAVSATGLDVRLVSQGRQNRINSELLAHNISLTAVQNGAPRSLMQVANFMGSASAPAYITGQMQRVATAFTLLDVKPEPWVWQNLDPTGSFPRDIKELSLDAETEMVLDDSALSNPQAVTIRRLFLHGVGLEMEGDAQGRVIGGQPEGIATLRLSGLSGFIDNAVAAGLMPAQQATVYKMVVENFAGKGERAGQRVFTIAMRDGQTFVNNFPIGPAPALPQ